MCCRFCCMESEEFAHTASTSWCACRVIVRRCSIADLLTPATSQQGSTRGLGVGLVAPGGPVRIGTWAEAYSTSAAERTIPVSSAESTVFSHDIGSLLWKTPTQLNSESCTCDCKRVNVCRARRESLQGRPCWSNQDCRQRIAKLKSSDAQGQRKPDAIIVVCSHLAVCSGRVAQLAEQLTLNQ